MKHLFILVITTIFVQQVVAQGSVRTFDFEDSSSLDGNTDYTFSGTLKFRLQDAGYGNSPTAVKFGFSNVRLESVTYKGYSSNEFLPGELPMSTGLQADIDGTAVIYKGNASVGFKFKLGWVREGGLDNFYIDKSDVARIYSIFGKEVTYNDVDIRVNALNISNIAILPSKVRSIRDKMEQKIREKEREKKLLEEQQAQETENLTNEEENEEKNEENQEGENSEKNNESNEESSAYKQRLEAEEKAKSEEAQRRAKEEAARKAREEAERKRKERKAKYDKRIKEQRKDNERKAAAIGASSVGLLYVLGGVIYNNIDRPVKIKDGLIFTGNSGFVSLDYGYHSTLIPYAFNSYLESYDGNNYSYKNETIRAYGFSVNFNLGLDIGYEHEYGGGYVFGDLSMGINPMLFAYSGLNYGYGSRIFGGLEGFKLFFEYESGRRAHTSVWDIAPEEFGEGHTSIEFQNFKAGIKFTWYDNSKTPYRNHVYLGVIEETITNYNESGFYVQAIKDLDAPTLYSEDKTSYLGYMGEWKYDNHSLLTIKFFLAYPFTGYRSGENIDVKGGPLSEGLQENKGFPFIQIGFVRSMDAFNIF